MSGFPEQIEINATINKYIFLLPSLLMSNQSTSRCHLWMFSSRLSWLVLGLANFPFELLLPVRLSLGPNVSSLSLTRSKLTTNARGDLKSCKYKKVVFWGQLFHCQTRFFERCCLVRYWGWSGRKCRLQQLGWLLSGLLSSGGGTWALWHNRWA